MSKQIRVAQNRRDERDFISQISDGRALLSLPRLMKGKPVDPVPLGECESRQQLIFSLEAVEPVIQSIGPLLGDPLVFQVRPAVAGGLCIEWSRTVEDAPGFFVVGGAAESRFFLDTSRVCENSDSAQSLLRSIRRFVVKSYPMIAEGSPPRYIGPDLSHQLYTGLAKLNYPNGTDVICVSNPKHYRQRGVRSAVP